MLLVLIFVLNLGYLGFFGFVLFFSLVAFWFLGGEVVVTRNEST